MKYFISHSLYISVRQLYFSFFFLQNVNQAASAFVKMIGPIGQVNNDRRNVCETCNIGWAVTHSNKYYSKRCGTGLCHAVASACWLDDFRNPMIERVRCKGCAADVSLNIGLATRKQRAQTYTNFGDKETRGKMHLRVLCRKWTCSLVIIHKDTKTHEQQRVYIINCFCNTL